MRSLRDRLRRFVRKLAREHDEPGRLFAACVLGAIVGSTPLFGLHLPICIALAFLFRLNKVAVYGAANVSIPPLAPFLGFACIQVGARLLTGHAPALTVAALRSISPWSLARDAFLSWLVGAPLVGGAIGVVLGAAVHAAARARKAALRDPDEIARAELLERFAQAPIGIRQYVRWKTRLDPVYRAIAHALPDAIHVVELGTGLGILPVLLALLGLRRKVTGVDHDQAKIEEGRRAAKGLRVELLPGDLRTFAIPPCDALVLIDVLHYLPREEQAEVLRRAADALRPRGVIFVRDADSAQGSGAGTRLMEAIAVRVGWNRGATPEATHWRPIREIEAELEALGFEVETSVVSGTLHPGNALLVARRP